MIILQINVGRQITCYTDEHWAKVKKAVRNILTPANFELSIFLLPRGAAYAFETILKKEVKLYIIHYAKANERKELVSI